MKLKKPATIQVSEPTTLEPGKSYTVREATPVATASTKRPVVGDYMSFHRLSESELREYYEIGDEFPFGPRLRFLRSKIYNTELGWHVDSPLASLEGKSLLEFRRKVMSEREKK